MAKQKIENICGTNYKVCSDCGVAIQIQNKYGKFTYFNDHLHCCGKELNSSREK